MNYAVFILRRAQHQKELAKLSPEIYERVKAAINENLQKLGAI